MTRAHVLLSIVLAVFVYTTIAAGPAWAGCGCEKPPPPRATVRPFVASGGQTVTLFDSALEIGPRYQVAFESTATGHVDWSQSRAESQHDLADGQVRPHLRVRVPRRMPYGPTRITVWQKSVAVFTVEDDGFTVAADAIPLHDFAEIVTRMDYRTAVGRDGTLYIPVDLTAVTRATTFTGVADGFGLTFQAGNVAMYNDQGFLMQLLDANDNETGLFAIRGGQSKTSDSLEYWRHEFATYKRDHRQVDHLDVGVDPDWHRDGTRHVNHDQIVVAIRGRLGDGSILPAGETPPFTLLLESTPNAH